MGYYIDFSEISIERYKEKLKKKTMIPSRMILKDRLEERFTYFKSMGIKNVLELQETLKKKEKLIELSKVECLSEDYLITLLRELKSIQSKPIKFSEFIGISNDTISKLEKHSIKNTSHLYDKVLTKLNRNEIANKTGISEKEILKLTKLTDLSRIQWVNSTFARVLFESGYDTSEKVSKANYEDLYMAIKKINEKQKLYKGNIGLNDMKICVEAAKEVPQEIEF